MYLWSFGHEDAYSRRDTGMDLVSDQRTGSPNGSTIEDHRSLSLSEFAENYENVLNENRSLVCRLSDTIQESARLKDLHERATIEFGAEKDRLNLEIGQLRAQISNRLESVIAAKERLIR